MQIIKIFIFKLKGKQPATGGKKTKEAIAKAAAARSKSGAKKVL